MMIIYFSCKLSLVPLKPEWLFIILFCVLVMRTMNKNKKVMCLVFVGLQHVELVANLCLCS